MSRYNKVQRRTHHHFPWGEGLITDKKMYVKQYKNVERSIWITIRIYKNNEEEEEKEKENMPEYQDVIGVQSGIFCFRTVYCGKWYLIEYFISLRKFYSFYFYSYTMSS